MIMTIIKSVLGVAAALAMSANANAQELWRGANVGDTPAEILEKFPEATLLDSPIAYDDSEGLIILDNFEVGGDIFDIRFLFSSDQLKGINLVKSRNDTGETPYSHSFHRLELLLAKRFGQPAITIPALPRDPAFLNAYENAFAEGDLTIKVSCIFCGDPKLGNLVVQYSYKGTQQANEF